MALKSSSWSGLLAGSTATGTGGGLSVADGAFSDNTDEDEIDDWDIDVVVPSSPTNRCLLPVLRIVLAVQLNY